MKNILAILPLLLCLAGSGQNVADSDFDFMVGKIRTAYAGFADKTDSASFDRLVEEVRRSPLPDTFANYSRVTSFFKDDHLAVFEAVRLGHKDSVAAADNLKNIAVWSRQRSADAIEGYWKDDLNNCDLYLHKTGDAEWRGYVVEANVKVPLGYEVLRLVRDAQGEWQFDFKDMSGPYRVIAAAYFKSPQVLVGGSWFKYRKFDPYTPGTMASRKRFSYTPSIRQLDRQTVLFRMPYFAGNLARGYDSLIRADSVMLSSAKTLIIDVRGNPGGSIRCFTPLFPYICTAPLHDVVGMQLCSEALIEDTRENIKEYMKAKDTARAERYRKQLDSLEKYKGKFRVETATVFPCDPAPNRIRHVALITDHGSRSAAELMVFYFRQSKKVTVFGENTGGAIDYLDQISYWFPHKGFQFWLASVKRQVTPEQPRYDGRGIPPDVAIPDEVDDWIGWVKKYYEGNAATIIHQNDSLNITYGNTTIFSGRIETGGHPYILHQEKEVVKGCTWQMITIRTEDLKPFSLDGRVSGSDDAIACESDPAEARIKVVRQVVGRSHSLLNNAVYERSNDWLISVDNYYSKVKVTPASDNDYDIHVSGWEIVVRFRPEYYKEHRGLSYFDPSAYQVWKKPVVGWCSWFAYLDQINEQEVEETADVISEKLRPFGLQYLQIDDGYEQQPIGLPDSWLHANAKFPSGLKSLASYISAMGLTPGVWTNVTFADSAAAFANRGLFVQDEQGRPVSGNWIGYVMDGSNPATIRRLITPVYKGLNDDGFGYFKLDALRHLKYEGYNTSAAFFKGKNIDRNEAYRSVASAVREEVGRGKFLLACWGIRPELVGIADGCRIGNDGFSYAGLAQFNSYNNIIWRNDPDHIVLSPKEAYRSCSATSLTGSLFMLTDKAETYRSSPLIEAARRTIPVLYTQPGQVYDVDPSRSSLIAGADVEMSGSGPRPFDASGYTTTGLDQLEINKPFENWVVLGRLDDRDKVLPFRDLGLDDKKAYLVFEFWTKTFRGVFRSRFIPGNIDKAYNCQAFCIRERLGHPQLLATNRHISCGGLEISDLGWKDNTLWGTSELVAKDKYILYLYEGTGYSFDKVSVKDAVLVANEKNGPVRKITMVSSTGGVVEWAVRYKVTVGGSAGKH